MDLHPFRILSLCSGVGGIELGFKLAEPTARTVCYVEIEAFACEILARRMEEKRLDAAPIWTNLKTFDGRPWRGKVDCITGGYPCQPFSVAGKKLGTNDPRHLWSDIKRLITEIEPPICFFENVSNHLRVGFEEVANDLRQMGYKIKAGLFAAEEVGAPHKRERLFILAYSDSVRSSLQRDGNPASLERKSAGEESGRNQFTQTAEDCCSGNVADCSFSGCIDGSDNISKRYLQRNLNGESEKNKQEWQRRLIGSCKNSENDGLTKTKLADCQDFICQWCEQQRSGSRKSEAKAGSYDNELADSESSGTRKHKRELWQGSEKYCGELGNATSTGLERHCQCQCSNQLDTWPPSPSNHERWGRISDDLKPALYRMADGLADRVDRIRACGNGVVPLVAAYAWRTLTNGMYLTKDN